MTRNTIAINFINKQVMTRFLLPTLLISAIGGFSQQQLQGGETTGITTLQSIAKTVRSPQVEEHVKVEEIAIALDSLAGANEGPSARNVAQILRLAAETPYSPSSQERESRVAQRRSAIMSSQVLSIAGGENKINRKLLFLSAGMLGANVDQRRIVAILDDPHMGPEIRLVAAEALTNQTQIDPITLPAVKKMSRDGWSYIVCNDVGPQNPHRVYPLREKAYEALVKLGVNCRKILREDASVDPDWNMKFSEMVIEFQ